MNRSNWCPQFISRILLSCSEDNEESHHGSLTLICCPSSIMLVNLNMEQTRIRQYYDADAAAISAATALHADHFPVPKRCLCNFTRILPRQMNARSPFTNDPDFKKVRIHLFSPIISEMPSNTAVFLSTTSKFERDVAFYFTSRRHNCKLYN